MADIKLEDLPEHEAFIRYILTRKIRGFLFSDLDDLVQDTFVRIYSSAKKDTVNMLYIVRAAQSAVRKYRQLAKLSNAILPSVVDEEPGRTYAAVMWDLRSKLDPFEEELVQALMDANNDTEAAQALGIHRNTLAKHKKNLEIKIKEIL